MENHDALQDTLLPRLVDVSSESGVVLKVIVGCETTAKTLLDTFCRMSKTKLSDKWYLSYQTDVGERVTISNDVTVLYALSIAPRNSILFASYFDSEEIPLKKSVEYFRSISRRQETVRNFVQDFLFFRHNFTRYKN